MSEFVADWKDLITKGQWSMVAIALMNYSNRGTSRSLDQIYTSITEGKTCSFCSADMYSFSTADDEFEMVKANLSPVVNEQRRSDREHVVGAARLAHWHLGCLQ